MSSAIWFIARWALRLLPVAGLAAVLHFYLPGHDTVRIVGTEVTRMDATSQREAQTDGGQTTPPTRDVRFINAVTATGKPAVYRNEDTRWGFPWYLKFNSGNLQAVAQDLVSTESEPKWVLVTHYGWRLEIFSMFPNTVEIDTVEGPEVSVIPWFNIVFLLVLGVALILVVRAWRRFLDRLELDERFENASNSVGQVWRWLKANRQGTRSAPGSRSER